MFKTCVRTYPWDFPAAAPGDVLDVIRGSWGADEITLRVGVPAGCFPRTAPDRGTFETAEGGIAFTPQTRRHPRSRLRALPLRCHSGFATFEAVLEACRDRDIGVRVHLSASRTGRLADAHADHACRDSTGSRSGQSLCLASEDAQAFLVALVEDLSTREGVTAIELADVVIRCGEYWTDPLRDNGRQVHTTTLLGLCFCESCLQQAAGAGIDPDAVTGELNRKFATPLPPTFAAPRSCADWERSHPALGAYFRLRAERIQGVVRECIRASAAPVFLERAGDADEAIQHEMIPSSLPAGWIIECSPESENAPASAAAGAYCRFQLARWLSDAAGGDALVYACKRCADEGYAGAEFDALGDLHGDDGQILRRAIRFGRRTGLAD